MQRSMRKRRANDGNPGANERSPDNSCTAGPRGRAIPSPAPCARDESALYPAFLITIFHIFLNGAAESGIKASRRKRRTAESPVLEFPAIFPTGASSPFFNKTALRAFCSINLSVPSRRFPSPKTKFRLLMRALHFQRARARIKLLTFVLARRN